MNSFLRWKDGSTLTVVEMLRACKTCKILDGRPGSNSELFKNSVKKIFSSFGLIYFQAHSVEILSTIKFLTQFTT